MRLPAGLRSAHVPANLRLLVALTQVAHSPQRPLSRQRRLPVQLALSKHQFDAAQGTHLVLQVWRAGSGTSWLDAV